MESFLREKRLVRFRVEGGQDRDIWQVEVERMG